MKCALRNARVAGVVSLFAATEYPRRALAERHGYDEMVRMLKAAGAK